MMQRLACKALSGTALRLLRPREAGGLLVRLAYSAQAFVIGIVLARGLGSDALGQYAYAMSWLQLASGLAIFGSPPLIVREVSAYLAAKQYGLARGAIRRATQFALFTALATIFSAVIIYLLGGSTSQFWMSLLIGLPLLIILPLTSVQEAISRGFGFVVRGQMAEFLVRPGLQLVLLLVLASGMAPWALSTQSAIAIFVVAGGVGLLTAIVIRRSVTSSLMARDAPAFEVRAWTKHLGSFALISWISIANQQISFILLGLISTDSEVAFLRVSTQLALLIPIGVLVMEAIQAPELSRLHATGDRAELQRLAHRSCRLALLAAAPLALTYVLFGDTVLSLLFGQGYVPASASLATLAIGQLANAAAGSVGVLTLATRNEAEAIKALGTALIVNASGCLVLVPYWGALGAAIAASASLVCWNVLMIVQVARRVGVVSLPYGTATVGS